MIGIRNVIALKVFLFIILLVIFFSLFFFQVIIQYAGKYTNFYKISKRADEIEVPTFTICTGWKESVMKKYDITFYIFSLPPDYETNLPSNYSIRKIYNETTYALNKDFFIAINSDISKNPIVLDTGINEMNGQKYHVKENPTNKNGMCYVVIPDQIWMRPFEDTLLITIFRNITSENKDMNQIIIQVSSNDTYNTVNEKMTSLTNTMLEQEFLSNGTAVQLTYTEENIEFIKECDEFGYFKCWAEKIAQTKSFNCTKKCTPIIFESIMEWTDEANPRCGSTAEENCMIGLEQYKKYMQLKSNCLKVCRCFCIYLDLKNKYGSFLIN